MGALGAVVLVLAAIAAREPEVGAPEARARAAARQHPHRRARLLAAQRQRRADRARDRRARRCRRWGRCTSPTTTSPRAGSARPSRSSPIAGAITTLTIARMADRLDRLKLVGLGTLLMAPAMGAMALPLGTPAFIAAMVAVRDRAGDRLHGLVPARGRRRRARRRRPGRRDGPALGELGRRRADRPGGSPARWPSSRTMRPAFLLAAALALAAALGVRWRTRELRRYSRRLPEGDPSAASYRSDRPRVGDEALRRRSWPSTTSRSRSTRASSSRCSARRAAARRRRCA